MFLTNKILLSSLLLAVLIGAFILGAYPVASASSQQFLDPTKIPQWVNQLAAPPVYVQTNVTDSKGNVIRQDYEVKVSEFYQQVLPTVDANGNPTGFGPTKLFGFGGQAKDAVTGKNLGFVTSVPGPTFEATRGVPTRVKWENNLLDANGNPLQHIFPVDPTMMWANPNNIDMNAAMMQFNQGLAPPFPLGYNGTPYTLPNGKVANPDGWNAQSPIPISIHLHGSETISDYDGGPDQWFTPNGIHGSDYRTAEPTSPNAAVYDYPNAQPATELWYHDHALGMTRLNIMAGLAGLYKIRDPSDQIASLLPSGQYEMPLVIQDRIFLSDGSLYFPTDGLFPNYNADDVLQPGGSVYFYQGKQVPNYVPNTNYTKVNPYAIGAFLGNTIMVNGKTWPNMNVEQGQYRFRILDGSNSRVYSLIFSNNMNFTLIGTDGGYLKSPVSVNSLLILPAERYDILVDFSKIPVGEKVVLKNVALIPPLDLDVQKQTLGQIVQFTVTGGEGFTPKSLPSQLNPTLEGSYPNLPAPTKTRIITLPENITANTLSPTDLYLNGQDWSAPISEIPTLGSTEDWVFVNTFDTHDIHLHLVQFQLVYRQSINVTGYFNDWIALNGNLPFNHPTKDVPSLQPYLTGPKILPLPEEQGWKDTIKVNSRQITVIRVRFAQQDGSVFPFDATKGPGYVWHCHLVDHEDMNMMRPYVLSQPVSALQLPQTWAIVIAVIIATVIGFLGLRNYSRKKRNSLNSTSTTAPHLEK